MIVYLDKDYRAHVAQARPEWQPWEDAANALGGKCAAYIEGLRIVPDGCAWVRADGMRFIGPMIAPAVDSGYLEAAQSSYEQASAEADATIAELDAALLDAAYQNIIGEIE